MIKITPIRSIGIRLLRTKTRLSPTIWLLLIISFRFRLLKSVKKTGKKVIQPLELMPPR